MICQVRISIRRLGLLGRPGKRWDLGACITSKIPSGVMAKALATQAPRGGARRPKNDMVAAADRVPYSAKDLRRDQAVPTV